MAALAEEMPEHYDLARLIHGKEPRGLSGWKPANSGSGADLNLHSLLGMAGFPVTAAHQFDADALGYVFGYHILHDPCWSDGVEQALASGRPIVVTPTFVRTARTFAQGSGVRLNALQERAVVLPPLTDANIWLALAQMPQEELDALRDRALDGTGISFHAPHNVSLHLFGDDVAVIENFRNEQVECTLGLDGWEGFDLALEIPAGCSAQVSSSAPATIQLPPRSLVGLSRRGSRNDASGRTPGGGRQGADGQPSPPSSICSASSPS